MHYGLVEFRRTSPHEDTDWVLHVEPVDYETDRDEQSEYKPNNSLFWHYPETITEERAIEMLLDKKVQEMEEEAEWAARTYVLQSEAFLKYRRKNNE